MLEFLANYGLFLAKIITLVIAILIVAAGVIGLTSRGKLKIKDQLEVKKINEKYESMAEVLNEEMLPKHEHKKQLKLAKKRKKLEKNEERKRIFVINFNGDIRATAVCELREEVTAILTVATPKDEVLVILESGGGLVNSYGLAASQLVRFKHRNIPLVVAIDKVAASGGYLMACVADWIIAAPFALVGSIGVVAQLPNFNRLLKHNYIDFEQITAGNFKRTLSLFGENTEKGRKKFKEEIENIHNYFKAFIAQYRSKIDIEKVSTGEYWLAKEALDFQLVDELKTSDDHLLNASLSADIYHVSYCSKKSIGEKFSTSVSKAFEKIFYRLPNSFLGE